MAAFNPIADSETILLVQKQKKNREEGWKRSQVHNLQKDIKDRRGKKRKRL